MIKYEIVNMSFSSGLAFISNYPHNIVSAIAIGVDHGVFPFISDRVTNSYGFRISSGETNTRTVMIFYIDF